MDALFVCSSTAALPKSLHGSQCRACRHECPSAGALFYECGGKDSNLHAPEHLRRPGGHCSVRRVGHWSRRYEAQSGHRIGIRFVWRPRRDWLKLLSQKRRGAWPLAVAKLLNAFRIQQPDWEDTKNKTKSPSFCLSTMCPNALR